MQNSNSQMFPQIMHFQQLDHSSTLEKNLCRIKGVYHVQLIFQIIALSLKFGSRYVHTINKKRNIIMRRVTQKHLFQIKHSFILCWYFTNSSPTQVGISCSELCCIIMHFLILTSWGYCDMLTSCCTTSYCIVQFGLSG